MGNNDIEFIKLMGAELGGAYLHMIQAGSLYTQETMHVQENMEETDDPTPIKNLRFMAYCAGFREGFKVAQIKEPNE